MEIESTQALRQHLDAGRSLRGVRLQDVDLSGDLGERLLTAIVDAQGLVVLGGRVPADVSAHLVTCGAIVFPSDPDLPVDPYRAHLYTADELYANLAEGYAGTPDARAYAWSREAQTAADAYSTAMQALHDDAVSDALAEVLAGRPTVGIMGGHAMGRSTPAYREVATLGAALAADGLVVLTGGGPGAMEAANLGAACRTDRLDEALTLLAAGPDSFTPDIDAWARVAFEARSLLGIDDAADSARNVHSVGIPTWFYGHEPPNVFGDVIAKFFSNAVREDSLLAASHEAVVVLAGAAGTVQEIFQCATPMYYSAAGAPMPELVLVGREQWTRTVPVWDALHALAQNRGMAEHVHLVDTIDDATALVTRR